MYKSTDGGNTWASANGTGSNALPPRSAFALAIAPNSPETLYAGTAVSSNQNTSPNMFKTVDGGQNWTPLSAAPPFWDVLVDPVDANLVFAGLYGLSRSMDGGQTWEYPFDEGDGYHGGMAFSADGSKLFLGSEIGAWLATDLTSSSLTLTNLNATLATSLLFGTAIHPTNPNIGVAGSQSNGVDLYSGALSWQPVACDDGGADAAFDFMNPSTIYITCAAPAGIQKLTDGGQTFSTAQNGIDASEFSQGASPALAMDPADSQRLYLAAAHVWQSNDCANTWTAISTALGPGNGLTEALAVAPSDPNTVYLGNSNGIYVTTNALAGSGATWSSVNTGLPSLQCTNYAPTCNYFSRIAVDPSSAGKAYVAFASYVSGHVYKTTNGGASWTDISGDLPNLKVNDIAIDPDIPQHAVHRDRARRLFDGGRRQYLEFVGRRAAECDGDRAQASSSNPHPAGRDVWPQRVGPATGRGGFSRGDVREQPLVSKPRPASDRYALEQRHGPADPVQRQCPQRLRAKQ